MIYRYKIKDEQNRYTKKLAIREFISPSVLLKIWYQLKILKQQITNIISRTLYRIYNGKKK